MSWLYTVIFAGLAFSSQGGSHQNVAPVVQEVPDAVERRALDETEKFDQTYPLNPSGKVSLSNVNGSIIVEASTCLAIGLLFAGGDVGGSNGKGLTFANPIHAVLDKLKIDLA